MHNIRRLVAEEEEAFGCSHLKAIDALAVWVAV